MARKIAVAWQKGGVGKTTVTTNLAARAAKAGQRVLLVEVDPQGNAADASGYPHRRLTGPTIYEALWGRMRVDSAWRSVPVAGAIRPTANGYDVLPANNSLAAIEWELIETLGQLAGTDLPEWALPLLQPRRLLRERLAAVEDRYDLILIDCPPSLGLLTVMALVAADEVLPVIQTEYLASSLDTAADFCETVALVQEQLNPALSFTGVVLNMFDGRRNHDIRAVERVKAFWQERGVPIFGTVLGRSVVFADATEKGQPAVLGDRDHAAVSDMNDLAGEVLQLA